MYRLIIILLHLLGFSFVSYGFELSSEQKSLMFSNVMKNVGLNCISPHRAQKNYQEFVEALEDISTGLSELSADMAILTGKNSRYPNLCHVMTMNHMNSYSEVEFIHNKGVKGAKKTTSPHPSYYWPKYIVEVMSGSNDPSEIFVKNNDFFILNRKISEKLSKLVNKESNLTTLNSIENALSRTHVADLQGVDDHTSLQVNLWPVAMSSRYAKKLSVCGPERVRLGLNAGGIDFGVEPMPMTCPLSMSNDINQLWKTGVLDRISPLTMKKVILLTDPKKCLADYGIVSTKANLGLKSGGVESYSEKIKKERLLSSYKKSILKCSMPLVTDVEGVLENSLSIIEQNIGTKYSCTPWGMVYPRSSKTSYANDFTFVNTALRYKSLANDILSIDRGEDEKWTIVYPWSARSHVLNGVGSPALSDVSTEENSLRNRLKQKLIEQYGESLRGMNSQEIVATEKARVKLLESTGATIGSSKRRIYTVWEKIKCILPVKKITPNIPGATTIYDSCKSAINLEVRKLFQTKFLRSWCDSMAFHVGGAFK